MHVILIKIFLICNIDIAILVENKPVYGTLFFFGYTVGGPCVGHLQIYHKDMLAGNDCLQIYNIARITNVVQCNS